MTPQEANALVTMARQHDHLVVDSDEQVKTWARSLHQVPYEAGKLIISEYYGKHTDPDKRISMDASVLRKLYFSKVRETQARQRALAPPESHQAPKGRLNMTRRTLLMWQERGHMLNQNPDDYPER